MPGKCDAAAAIGLYLDLLKKSLTNTIHAVEPDPEHELEVQYVHDFIQHYIRGSAVSMLPVARFDNLRNCVADAIDRGVPGDLIEAGVWRGGASIFMRAMLAVLGVTDRMVWVADSFEGLPEPDAARFPVEARTHQGPLMTRGYNRLAAGLDEVRANFAAYGMLDERVRFLKGWFKDTLPVAPIGALAVMRLDADYYESTMDALTNLYHRLSVGGYAIIDDYGESTWTYCREAVDDFRRARGIDEPMERVDSKCYFWKRAR